MRIVRIVLRKALVLASLAAVGEAIATPVLDIFAGGPADELAKAVDDTALHATLILMAAMLALREMRPSTVAISLGAATVLFGWLDLTGALHAFLLSAGAYPHFLVVPGSPTPNPQSALVVAFVAVLFALAASSLPRWRRTFDRIAACVLGTSVALTGLLFHSFTVASVVHDRNAEMALLRSLATMPDPLPACVAIGLDCRTVGADAPTGIEGIDRAAASVLAAASVHPSNDFLHAWAGTAGIDTEVGNYVAAVSRHGDGPTRLLVSTARPSERFEFESLRFSVEAAAAHATWLALAAGVCALHSPRRRARRAMAAVSPVAAADGGT